MVTKEEVTETFRKLQDTICTALVHADGKAVFKEEHWQRHGGGGGRTRVMQNGNVIEKGGVNFSAVHGTLPESLRKALEVENPDFFATGVSIVMHPSNPWVPIIHMNVRYFEIENEVSWFGGGIDLTPHYVIDKDARFFHTKLKETCDKFSTAYYPTFKKEADEYFFIKHRDETRGIGGIFFDKLKENTLYSKRDNFELVRAIGNQFAPLYIQLINNNRDRSFSEQEKEWQLVRRGRYVEFNLVYDKGTRFGLETDGRTESILMSLPPLASWLYDFKPAIDSEEARTLGLLKKGIDWVSNKL